MKPKSPRRCIAIGFAMAVTVIWAPAVGAVVFDVVGVDGTGFKAQVSFAYTPLSPSSGKLDIDILNTSPVANPADPPRVTGFAFNLPANVTGLSSFSAPFVAANGGWAPLFGSNILHPPFNAGAFDIAAATFRTDVNSPPETFLQGGGSPSVGIPVGDTRFGFDFFMSGTQMETLDASSFLFEQSFDPPGEANEAEQSFLVRFITLGGTFSDTALIHFFRPMPPPEPAPPLQTPEPTILFLLAPVLFRAGACFWRRPDTGRKRSVV